MTLALPIKEMSRTEKLRAMDDLWHDLASAADEIDSPEWHDRQLRETAALVASGSATFADWAETKVRIRQQVAFGL